jgi:hypothetical protein
MTACDKIQYSTIKEAKKAADGIGKIHKQHMRVYTCEECRCYHLTTVKLHQRKVAKEKYKVDYTLVRPLKVKKIVKQARPCLEKQMSLATYRPFEGLAKVLKHTWIT